MLKSFKKSIFLSAALLVLLSAQSSYANAENDVKLYGIKSGILETKVETKFSDSTSFFREILIWDNWGLKTAKFQMVPDIGTKGVIFYKVENGRIAQDKVYLVQLKDMSYQESAAQAQNIFAQLGDDEQGHVAEALMQRSGSQKNNITREWNGHVCEEWVHPVGNTNCLWNGIILYTELGTEGVYQSLKTPIKLYEGDVDQKYFEIPGPSTPD